MGTTPDMAQVLEDLENTSTLDELSDVAIRLRDRLQIEHLIYHWVDGAGDQYGYTTYPDAWADRYLERNYHRIDPVILGCFQRFHPVDWKSLDWSGKVAKNFLQDALEHGVGNQGYSIPIRGPNGQFALFTVNHTCDDASWTAFIDTHGRELILIAHYFNRKALEFERDRQPDAPRGLSPREVDAMTLLALGYSRAQVAHSLSISEHTLRVYIESARAKLGAQNTTHAIATALSRGLIVV
ncbi:MULTISPECIES: LuxR family transcriptional regulator [unclassified Ruegeria]|uniref:helix-turn-helix transcriptional regulator n=1 Tax=unclassified Ruegeria TaxID=2625375 RepID=UPI001AD95D51|nr:MULTISPECIES: LuxR family transcriptional regulator [unclassified Ruegeria]MBO9411528.1 LuxR family transcriptional regulator [Ruegeria sp. R8_1]MBO9415910.1 LuxR family transcriptional regulator [Ruegeria sp. R8_2]